MFVPFFAQAQDYSSPSVMKISQSPAVSVTEFWNYSYSERPFENIAVNISVGYYTSEENVVHQIAVNAANLGDRHVVFGSTPYYCRIGTNDCKPFACNYYSGEMELGPHSSGQRYCTITANSCAGREIRMEYTLQGVRGTVITKTVAKCPQKFCDRVATSVKVPGISYVGDKILAEGFLIDMAGEGVPSHIDVKAGGYIIKVASNEFGYWSAPLEISKPGYYELSAISESCSRIAKAQFQLVQKAENVSETFLSVYPKSIGVVLGGSALLAINLDSDEKISVSVYGVQEDWIEPAKFTMSRGIRFVYISPGAEGNYEIAVRAGREERNVSLFVAPATMPRVEMKSTQADALVFATGLLLLFYSKSAFRVQTTQKRDYLGAVKKEIEDPA